MTILAWILTRLVAGLLWAGLIAALGYYVIVPAIVRAGYQSAGTRLDRFELQGGEEASGSEDAVYYAARYDCRKTITRIRGTAPDALYWMIGIYDTRLQRIPGGHLNDATVETDEQGRFSITIRSLPGPISHTLECGRQRTGLIIMRVFLPQDRTKVTAPTIQRMPLS
jgi:uncharacterized membrane protein